MVGRPPRNMKVVPVPSREAALPGSAGFQPAIVHAGKMPVLPGTSPVVLSRQEDRTGPYRAAAGIDSIRGFPAHPGSQAGRPRGAQAPLNRGCLQRDPRVRFRALTIIERSAHRSGGRRRRARACAGVEARAERAGGAGAGGARERGHRVIEEPAVENVICVGAGDIDGLVALARERSVDLTVVGPEAPLVAGIADRFEAEGLRIFGPSAAAARLEGSKAFTKAFLAGHGIPTARHAEFTDPAAAARSRARPRSPDRDQGGRARGRQGRGRRAVGGRSARRRGRNALRPGVRRRRTSAGSWSRSSSWARRRASSAWWAAGRRCRSALVAGSQGGRRG